MYSPRTKFNHIKEALPGLPCYANRPFGTNTLKHSFASLLHCFGIIFPRARYCVIQERLIMGLFDMVGNLIGMGVQAGQNKKARRWQEAQINKQWTRDRQMWREQNEYNSPEAQMARFQEAGLNPHLAVTGGNPGNAASMPSANAPRGQFGVGAPTGGDGTLGEFQALKMMKNQNKQLELNQENTQEDINKKKILNSILRDLKDEKKSYELSKYQHGAKSFEYDANIKQLEAEWRKFKKDAYIDKDGNIKGINIDKDNVLVRVIAGWLQGNQGEQKIKYGKTLSPMERVLEFIWNMPDASILFGGSGRSTGQ